VGFGVAGASVVAVMLDGAVSDTGSILSTNFSSKSKLIKFVLLTASDSMVATAVGVGVFIGEVPGAPVAPFYLQNTLALILLHIWFRLSASYPSQPSSYPI
jgi:hypothetical protein